MLYRNRPHPQPHALYKWTVICSTAKSPFAVEDETLSLSKAPPSFFHNNQWKSQKQKKKTKEKKEKRGVLIHLALNAETEVERSDLRFQIWHSVPVPSILLSHSDLHSRSVLKQMTLGFPL